MNLPSLISTIIAIVTIGATVDFVMSSAAVANLQDKTKDARNKIESIGFGRATKLSNEWFLNLFDAVYGSRWLSVTRLVRSVLSSLLAVFLISLLLGWEGTSIANAIATKKFMLEVLFTLFVINLIADYISLQETRLVLKWSQQYGVIGIFGWGVVDIFATAIIFVVVINVGDPVLFMSYKGLSWSLLWSQFELSLDRIGYFDVGVFWDKSKVLPLFLSTFLTSLLWWLYIVAVLSLRFLRIVSPVAVIALNAISESEHPARVTAGFVVIVLAATFGVVQIASLVISLANAPSA